jgi:hypothetical protein
MKKVYVVVDAFGSVFGVYVSYRKAELARYARIDCKRITGSTDTRVFIQCKYLDESLDEKQLKFLEQSAIMG